MSVLVKQVASYHIPVGNIMKGKEEGGDGGFCGGNFM